MQYTATSKSAGKKTARFRVFSRLTLAFMVVFLFVSSGFQLSPAKADYATVSLGSASQLAVLAGTAGGYIPTWKSTLGGKAVYRIGGILALGLLLYMIFIGFA